MPKPPRRQFSEGLLPLQQDYLRRVTKYITDVRRLRELIEQNKLPLQDLQLMLRLTNNLTGSGTTFGFPEISRTARELHAALQDLTESDDTDSRRSQNHVLEKLAPFEEACLEAVNPQITPIFRKQKKSSVGEGKKATDITVWLVALSPSTFDFLLPEIAAQGLQSVAVLASRKWTERITDEAAAVIFYSDDPARDLANLGPFPKWPETFLLISPNETFEARLSAVRAGVEAYFAPTSDAKMVIATLSQLAGWSRTPSQKARILLVDNDETAAAFYSQSLEQAEFQVSVTSKPQHALEIVAMHPTDLVILPYNLQECTGIELSLMMRQLTSDQDSTIIIMAAQKEVENSEIESLKRRRIYFIIKPFTPSQLVSQVTSTLINN